MAAVERDDQVGGHFVKSSQKLWLAARDLDLNKLLFMLVCVYINVAVLSGSKAAVCERKWREHQPNPILLDLHQLKFA